MRRRWELRFHGNSISWASTAAPPKRHVPINYRADTITYVRCLRLRAFCPSLMGTHRVASLET